MTLHVCRGPYRFVFILENDHAQNMLGTLVEAKRWAREHGYSTLSLHEGNQHPKVRVIPTRPALRAKRD